MPTPSRARVRHELKGSKGLRKLLIPRDGTTTSHTSEAAVDQNLLLTRGQRASGQPYNSGDEGKGLATSLAELGICCFASLSRPIWRNLEHITQGEYRVASGLGMRRAAGRPADGAEAEGEGGENEGSRYARLGEPVWRVFTMAISLGRAIYVVNQPRLPSCRRAAYQATAAELRPKHTPLTLRCRAERRSTLYSMWRDGGHVL